MNFIQSLLPAIEHFHSIGYWLAFLAALSETTIGIGLFIPGSTIVLFMGALAAQNYFDLGDLIWFAVIGAILGDNINYFIGKKYGERIFANGFWFVKPEHFKKGKEFFEKYGAKSILFGRFIPTLKEINPLIAGTFGMKRFTFMFWNILGAIGWSLVWILPGYFFAQSLNIAKLWLTRAGYFFVVFVLILIILYILKILLIKKGKQLFIFLHSIWRSIKQGIKENNEVQKMVQRHQKLFGFIRRRLDRENFFGLPVTLLGMALIYVLSFFAGIIEDIINSDIITSIDIRVANLLEIFRHPILTKTLFWITLFGKWQIILFFTIIIILILWVWKKRVYIFPLLLSIVGSEIFTTVGKLVFHRVRPENAIYVENSFSFPSGHATIAVAFYGFIIYFLIKNVRSWNRKINIFFTGFILTFLIGFSRLYLGVHYVSDVWAGYLIGAIWLIIAMSFTEFYLHKQSIEKLFYINTKKIITTIGLIFLAVGFYVIFTLNYPMPNLLTPQARENIVVNNIVSIFLTHQLEYTETLLGSRQQPLSFIIIAKDDQQFVDLFQQSNWVVADKVSVQSVARLAQDVIWKKPYPEAPMTPDFWNSEVHNFGFEKSTETNSVRTRHHARFWKTNYTTENGDIIYVGTASFDSGLKWLVTHRISPDIDTEREFLFSDLQTTGLVTSFEKKQFVNPVLGTNFSGDLFFTNGELYIVYIVK